MALYKLNEVVLFNGADGDAAIEAVVTSIRDKPDGTEIVLKVVSVRDDYRGKISVGSEFTMPEEGVFGTFSPASGGDEST